MSFEFYNDSKPLGYTEEVSYRNGIAGQIADIILDIGDIATLNTDVKTSLVAALNLVNSYTGSLSNLTTTAKDNIVNALNELKTAINDIVAGSVTDGSITDLKLDPNGIRTTVANILTNIGILAELPTTDKTNLVNSLKEIDANIDTTNLSLADIQAIDLIRKPNQTLNVACTLMGSSDNSTFTTWGTKMTGLSCGIQVSTLETITDSTSIDFTPTANLSNTTISSMKSITGKSISVLKPHIVTASGGDSFSRSNYNPTDKTGFFTNWTNRLLVYAGYCNTNNIPYLCITCEMAVLTTATYTSNWITLINAIKAQYPNIKLVGAFTIAEFKYQTDNLSSDVLVKYLDVAGLNLYPTLDKTNLMKSMIISKLTDNTKYVNVDSMIIKIKQIGKTVWITETGCSNYYAGTNNLYPIYIGTTIDYTDTRIFLNTVLEYVSKNNNIDQVHLWHINTPFDFLSDTQCKSIVQGFYGGGN